MLFLNSVTFTWQQWYYPSVEVDRNPKYEVLRIQNYNSLVWVEATQWFSVTDSIATLSDNNAHC